MTSTDRSPAKRALGPLNVHTEIPPEASGPPEPPPPIPPGRTVGLPRPHPLPTLRPAPQARRPSGPRHPPRLRTRASRLLLDHHCHHRRQAPGPPPGTQSIGRRLPATVQRSLARLEAAGYLRRRRVPRPDPDEPRNLTGWRYDFPFADGQATDLGPPPGAEGEGETAEGPEEVTRTTSRHRPLPSQ